MPSPAIATRQEARRRAVLDAAVRLFSRRGYRTASMRDLAEEVGLSKPALYHYVQSKEQVLVLLYEEVLHESLTGVQAVIGRSTGPAIDALREVIIYRVAYTCEHQALLRVFFEEESQLPRDRLATVLEDRRALEDAVAALVTRAVEEGDLTLPGGTRIFVYSLLGAVNWVYKWYDPKGRLGPRELGAAMADALLAGVRSD